MLRQHPVRRIGLKRRDEAIAEDARLLAACPHLGGVRQLDLELLGAGLLRIVLDSPHWTRLVALVVPEPPVACSAWQVDILIDELSESAALARLKTLRLGHNRASAECLGRLLAAPLVRLETLDLSGGWQFHRYPMGGVPNPDGASSVSYHPAVSSAAVEALAQARAASSLRILDVRYNGLSTDAVRALLESPYLRNLEQLHLSEPGSEVLTAFLPELRRRFPSCFATS